MRKGILFTILFFASLLFVTEVRASHLLGADLTYQCIGPNQYRVTLNMFRDCQGISAESSHTVSYYSATCGVSGSITVNSVGPGVDITPVCPGQATSCNGNGTIGIEKYVYQGILTLPAGCLANDWVLGWSMCCRNAATTTLSGASSNDMYIQTVINDLSSVTPCNSSPVFNNLPASIVCINKPVNYNHGAVDPDGDSLVFSLANCRQSSTSNVTYAGSFSGTNPLATTSGVTINSSTGAISFTPNQIQVGVLCVKVEEYRNGVKIGETVRDMQFNVINCNNDAPISSGINGSSNTNPLNFQISTCANSPVCFTLNLSDPNSNNVNATWNNGIAGGTVTFTNQNTPNPTAEFCWTPTNADLGTNFFTITLRDNACPITGNSTFTYTVNVIPSPHTMTISPDQSICPGESVNLTATAAGSTGINWTPALGLNTTTGGNVTATPAATQTYTATASFSDGCDLSRTVTVNIKPLPQVAINPRNILACAGQNITLNATSATIPAPTYSWSTGAVGATINVAPVTTTTYTVTATSNSCTASANTTITINQPTGQACNVIYAAPTGVSTNDGTKGSPYDLATAIQKGGCQGAVIKMAVGTYTLDNPLNMLGELTLEGGFDPANSWRKTSAAGATTITRSANNVEDQTGASPRIVAFYGNGVQNIAFQDLTITTANAPTNGSNAAISTYAVHFTNCANYTFRRCQLLPGNGGTGANGTAGTAGVAGANGNSGSGGDCDGGDCTFGGDLPGGAGGRGGNGAGGANGGNGGPSTNGAQDNGVAGAVAAGRNGGAGGGGGAGGDECSNNNAGVGASGGNSNGVLGGAGGARGNQGNPGNAGSNGSSGSVGSPGSSGAPGGTGSVGVSFFVPGIAGGNGTDGQGGSGGGGGGGGGRQDCAVFCDRGPGNGGGGGGGGGQGGTGGTGGTGGGASFALFLVNNGSGSIVVDCNLLSGTAGAGGSGGVGGSGGSGGSGGNGGNVCTGEIGRGGNGGNGGTGGAGGAGGAGQPGIAFSVYVNSGIAPAYTNDGAATAINVGAGTNPPAFGLAAQPVIQVEDKACMGLTTGFFSSAANLWNLGTGASPLSPNTQNPTTVYNSLGRKDIAYNANNYRGFHNVIISNTLGPDATTDAPLVSGVYRICQNNRVGFSVTNPGLGYIYDWNIKNVSSGATVFGVNGTQYDTTSYFFNVPGTYYAIVTFETSCCGISNPDTVTLVVDTVPDITALTVGDNTLCYDATTTITATVTNGTVFTWTPVASISGPNDGTMIGVQPSVTTTYSILVSNANGRCIDTASTTVVVNTISLAGSSTGVGCTPDGTATVTVTGTAGNFLYQWSNGTTNGPTATMTNTINNLSEGIYIVTVTNQTTGCADTIQIQVSKATGSFSGFVNNVTNVTCNGLNNGTATYVTFNANNPVTAVWLQMPGMTIANPNALGPGNYKLTLTDNSGCVSVNTFSVTEPLPQGVDSISLTGIICDTALRGSITVAAMGGNGGNTYLWSNGATTPTITGLPVGSYTVTATDRNGCAAQRTFNISLQYTFAINLTPTDPLCYNGTNGTIVATPTNGLYPYNYAWSASGQTDSILDGQAAGQYTVIVTDGNNCTATRTATMNNPAQMTVSISSNPGDTICAGNTTNLTATSNYTANYLWNGTTAGAALSNVGAGNYTVVATNSNNCTATASKTVVELPNHSITLTSAAATEAQTLCEGVAVTNITYSLGGGATGATVTGLPSGITGNVNAGVLTISGSSSAVGTHNYSITTTGNNCVVATESGTIIILPNHSITLTSAASTEGQTVCVGVAITNITYSLGGGATGATVTGLPTGITGNVNAGIVTISGNSTAAGTYNYSISTTGNNCVVATESGTIVITPNHSITLTSAAATEAQTVCAGVAITNITYSLGGGATGATVTGLPTGISGNVGGGVFTISGSTATAGTYNYTITTTGNNCVVATESGTITVTPNHTLTLTSAAGSNSQQICIGNGIANVTYTFGGGATGATVTGLPTGVTANVAGNSVTISGTPAPAGTYNFTVTTTGNACQVATLSGTIDVSNPPVIDLGGPYKSCCENVVLNPNSNNPNVTYIWSDNSTGSTLTLSGNVHGNYSVTVTSAQNCSATDNAQVDIYCINVGAGLTASPDTIKIGTTGNSSQLEVITAYSSNFTYSWSPSSTLNDATISNPVATPVRGTTYSVTVTDMVSDCADSAIIYLEVIFNGKLKMPTAFTPNGDGKNDLFFPVLSSPDALQYLKEFRIYNRWGQLMYDNVTTGWDGTFNNAAQPNEVYYYYVKAAFPDPNNPTQRIEQAEHGSFTLIR